jgi:hypothetical protein
VSEEELLERGYEAGYEDAEQFIDRHPHGMPWVVARELDDEPKDNPYEQGFADGFRARLKEEGWL